LGDTPASEFYVPTFWNILPVTFSPPTKMEYTECSETSAHKIQTPGNHRKERIQQNIIYFHVIHKQMSFSISHKVKKQNKFS